MKRKNWILLAVNILIWGSSWTAMKIGCKLVNPLNFVMQRFLFASIALLPALPFTIKSFPKDGRTWLKLLVLSLFFASGISLTHIALEHETTGLSSLLTYTQPLFVFCLAVPFLKEKATVIKALGVIMGFTGVATLYMERIKLETAMLNTILFLMIGAFFWAVTIVYYKKFLTHVTPVIVNFIETLLGFTFLFAATLAFQQPILIFNYSLTYVFAVLYTAVLGFAVASNIWLILLKDEETITVATSSLTVPVIAAVFGYVFLEEAVSTTSLLSFILVLTGIYLVNVKEGSESKKLHSMVKGAGSD
ncbi:MAG: DMT family transporter [Candidatus Bathyarchaeia archaeon]